MELTFAISIADAEQQEGPNLGQNVNSSNVVNCHLRLKTAQMKRKTLDMSILFHRDRIDPVGESDQD